MLGLTVGLAIGGCKVTTSDDDDDNTFGGDSGEEGGSGNDAGNDGQGGTGNQAGTGEGGNQTAGSGNTEFTAADCPAAAALEEENSCGECVYENLCDAVVPCENRSGCIDAVNAMVVCISQKYEENAAGGDEGYVTQMNIDDCAGESNMASSGEASDLWAAIANEEDGGANCRYECWLD